MANATLVIPAVLGSVVSPSAQAPDSVVQLTSVVAATPPIIDGVLANGEWSGAAVATGFIQYEPQRGDPYKLTPALSVQYDLERLTLDPDPENESTWIHVVRADQFFTKDLFLRVFFQTNSAIDRENIQAIFVWRYRPPFGTIQVVYQRGTAEFGERSEQGNTLFLKATAVF